MMKKMRDERNRRGHLEQVETYSSRGVDVRVIYCRHKFDLLKEKEKSHMNMKMGEIA